MEISHKKLSKKQWILIVLVIIVLVAAVGVGIFTLQHKDSKKASSTSPSSSQTTSSKDSSPKVNTNAPTPDEVNAGNATKSSNANSTPPPSPTNTLSITANNTGSIIQIRSTITENTNDGSCSLVLTKGGTTITEDTVGIQALPGYSTCKGWNIDVSTLSAGSWTATVTASYNSTSNTATANFQI